MYVYHGSNHNFRVLRIRKDLTKDSTLRNEGYGVYFSTDRDVAKTYGEYLYTIRVNDKYIFDMRKLAACRAYLRNLSRDVWNQFAFHLETYIDVKLLAECLQSGKVAISGVGQEVANMLDSTEMFYTDYRRSHEDVYKWLEKWTGVPKVYLFTYHVAGSGIIRDVSPNIAVITSKEHV